MRSKIIFIFIGMIAFFLFLAVTSERDFSFITPSHSPKISTQKQSTSTVEKPGILHNSAKEVAYDHSKYNLFTQLTSLLLFVVFIVFMWNRKLSKLNENLNLEVAQRRRIEKAQAALNNIALAVLESDGLDEFYSVLHKQISKLMQARNFYVAAYDGKTISFPYFLDEKESFPREIDNASGLTDYVLKSGKALYSDKARHSHLSSEGNFALPPDGPLFWAGAPLKFKNKIIGIIAVQSYNKNEVITRYDLETLIYISSYVAIAIERLHLLEEAKEHTLALKKSEERFRSFFEDSGDAMVLLEDGRIIECNASAYKLLGLSSREELLDIDPAKLAQEHQSNGNKSSYLIDKYQKEALKKGWVRFEWSLRNKDNSELTLEALTTPISYHNRTVFHMVIRDITERKEKEAALAEREVMYRSLFDHAGYAIVLTTTTGTVQSANPEAVSMFGCSSEAEMLRHHPLKFMPEFQQDGNSSQEFYDSVMETLLHEGGLDFEATYNRLDGSEFIAQVRVRKIVINDRILLQSTLSDITERRMNEKALRISNRRLNDIIEFLPDPTMVVDNDGIVRAWNKAIEEISGVSKKDILGKGNYEYALPFYNRRRPILIDSALSEDTHTNQTHYEALDRKGDTLYGEVYTPFALNGEGAYFWGVAGPLKDETGKVVGAIECMRNITQRKNVELELNKARITAEAATRVKSEFLANMSHEIRTPMNSIVGFGHLLQSSALESSQRDYLGKIMSSAESLLSIIDNILDFSKIEAGKFTLENIPFNLDGVLDKICNMVAVKVEQKGIDFVLSVDPEIPKTMIGDPLRMEQILTNLSSNAVKFTEQGEVDLIVSYAGHIDDKIHINFCVKDSGIGLSEDEMENLFSSFTQADASITRKYGGTGLGLAITNNIVTQMGSTISVDSSPNQGSSFSFTIVFGAIEGETAFTLPVDMDGLKALVIDDSKRSTRFISSMLKYFCFDVVVEHSTLAAIDALTKEDSGENTFDIIFIDWKTVELNGLETVSIIRELTEMQETPIIMLSPVHAVEELKKQAAFEGADGFITKPVTRTSLKKTLINEFALSKFPVQNSCKIPYEEVNIEKRLKRILLVEDNRLNQQVAKKMLENFGLAVDVAPDGRKALEALWKTPYDLVLMDIQMPEMDGLTATRLIRSDERYDNLPILAMTAHGMQGDKEKSLEAGMNEHLVKPVSPATLQVMLSKYLNEEIAPYSPVSSSVEEDQLVLPHIEGIDCLQGLKNIGGNYKGFMRVLRGFKLDYTNFMRKLEQLISQADFVEAGFKIHSLKGVAGNIGAFRLFELCRMLETDLKTENHKDFNKSLILFANELQLILNGLEALEKIPVKQHNYFYDADKSFKTMTKLHTLLNEGNAESQDVLDELRTYFNPDQFIAEFHELTTNIDNFDFDEGRLVLEKIAKKTGHILS